MKLTIEGAKLWAQENHNDLDKKRLNHPDDMVQMMNKMIPEKSGDMGFRLKEIWDSGCWLGTQLELNGATEEQISSIQMAMGQRAFGGCPWQAAVNYANEFIETGDTEEKGGMELAEKLHNELFGG